MNKKYQRDFGILMGAVTAGIGLYLKNYQLLVPAALLIGIAFLWPAIFRFPAYLWQRLALILNFVVQPIILGIIYFIIISPVAIAMRIAGRDVLNIKPVKKQSYWIDRDGPAPDAMRQQY